MDMIKEVYSRAFSILMKKPVRLWGISLLGGLLGFVAGILFSVPLGLSIMIAMLLETGLAMVFLHGIRGEEVKAVQLFDCFRDWGTIKRVLAGRGWRALWIFLWSLIPFAVGLINGAGETLIYMRGFARILWGILWGAITLAAQIYLFSKVYSWYLVPYILVEEPDVAPTEALAVSKQRTDGKRLQIFFAELLPVVLILAALLILGLLARIPYVGVLFLIVMALLGIAALLLLPLFEGLVSAAIYEKLSGAAPAEAAPFEAAPAEEAPAETPAEPPVE